jgi:hypothetical protein
MFLHFMLLLLAGFSALNNAHLNCNIKAHLPIVIEADMLNLSNVILYQSTGIGKLTDRRITMNTIFLSDQKQ